MFRYEIYLNMCFYIDIFKYEWYYVCNKKALYNHKTINKKER